jgi:Rieske Fe-S protein
MDRRKFIQHTCLGCLGGSLVPLMLTRCQSTHYVNGTLEAEGIVVPLSEFTYLKKEQTVTRPYILIQNDTLEFPIYVYRFSEKEYSALWMKCTHQGSELQASGDHLHCPGHGSEFNNKGVVSLGPAEKNLRTFPVTVGNDKLKIDLRQS